VIGIRSGPSSRVKQRGSLCCLGGSPSVRYLYAQLTFAWLIREGWSEQDILIELHDTGAGGGG
jgi:hypothetical protein